MEVDWADAEAMFGAGMPFVFAMMIFLSIVGLSLFSSFKV